MKIIKKSKQFVKENWKPILTGVGIGGGCFIAYLCGAKAGINALGEKLSKEFGVNLKEGYAYNQTTVTLRDVVGDEIPEVLMDCGFNDLDETINAVALIQKIES